MFGFEFWDEILRGGLALLYGAVVARSGWMLLHHQFIGTRKIAGNIVGAIATGWTIYYVWLFVNFFGPTSMSNHSLITEFGRTFHVANAVGMHLVLFILAERRAEDALVEIIEETLHNG